MIERDKLPTQETIDFFLSEAEVQDVYKGLTLAERAYSGNVRAGIDAMLNRPKEFEAAGMKYLGRPNPNGLIQMVIFGGGGLGFAAMAVWDLINGNEAYLIALKCVTAVFGVLAAYLTRLTRKYMVKRIESIFTDLDAKPATLNSANYLDFLRKNSQLKAYAEKLNEGSASPTMRELVALKFHEIDLLGAVSN